MKTHPKSLFTGMLATMAVATLCLTSKADLVGGSYTAGTVSPTTWDLVGGLSPFWASVTNVNPSSAIGSNQTPPPSGSTRLVAGALYYPIAESIVTPSQRYKLTAATLLLSGSAAATATTPLQIHLFDVTSTLRSGDGSSATNGAGAMFDIGGDLMGNGVGLTFTNNGLAGITNQCIFTFANGSLGNDANIVLGDGHIYALEIWAPSAAPSLINWWRTGGNVNDCGTTGEGFLAGGEYTNRITLTSAGNAGGAPRNMLLALFGTTTTDPITVSTNPPPGLTSYVVDTFPSATYSGGSIINVWTNWFGTAVSYPSGLSWDTSDAAGLANSGSLKISANFDASPDTQFAVMNGYNGINPALDGRKMMRLEADVKFASGSATTINGTTVNYGHLQLGSITNGTGGDYYGSIEIPSGNNGWNHVVMPVNEAADTNLIQIPDVIVHIDGNWYTGTPLSGSSTLYVDNIKFTGKASMISAPPTMVALSSATPALRLFAPSGASTGARQNIGTVYSNFTFYGQSPVSYAVTFTNFPGTNAGQFEFHMMLVPVASLRTDYGGLWWNNAFVDNDTTNLITFKIQANTTNYTASVLDKINMATGVPANVLASTTTLKATGTWTLAFSSDTAGTLTGPGGVSLSFSLPPADAAKFNGDVTVVMSVLPNDAGGLGQSVDISSVLFNTPNGYASDNFQADFSLDFGTWVIGAADPKAVWLTGPGAKYWVDWSSPDIGYSLVESTNLFNPSAWVAPAVYHSGTAPVKQLLGNQNWALLETNHVPSGVIKSLFFAVRAAQ